MSKMIKDIVEPMFKTMLPGPLKTLHFTKIDLGAVPLKLSNAKTIKTEHDGIQLDMNVDWVGKADIEMDADMIPALVSEVLFRWRAATLMRVAMNRELLLTLPLLGRRKYRASRQAIYIVVSTNQYHSTSMSCNDQSDLYIDTHRSARHKSPSSIHQSCSSTSLAQQMLLTSLSSTTPYVA